MLGGLRILQFVFVLVISTPTCRTASELLTFGTVKVDVEKVTSGNMDRAGAIVRWHAENLKTGHERTIENNELSKVR